jgi:hypothetical protein
MIQEDTMSEPAVYEFGGVIFETSGEFLDALAHEYKIGDKEMVVSILEDYGFDLGDIGV